ncbi:MAG TPA: RidA family protein [Ktedonobacteraceae bacterium]|nr:RidA family protein [Ktedonobacteraceae bacterium]
MERQRISTGSPWEGIVGYSRAVRVGNLVFVAGTTASAPNGQPLYPGDAYEQTRTILARIEAALHDVGAELSDVVQTRLYVRDIKRWEEIGRAHGEVFREIRPVTSMVEVSRLIDSAMLVEIEAMAVISESAHEKD